MKKLNIDFEKIIAFLKTPKGKATLFFGFYLVFFVVLISMLRTGDSSNTNKTSGSKDNVLPFSFEKLDGDNYHFKYIYKIDDKEYIYEGDRKDGKELFEYNKVKYYRNDDEFLTNKSNIWVKADNPYLLKDFINVYTTKKLAKKASYISKTEYESGMTVYTYQIATTTLIKILEKTKVDLDDPVNEIVFKTDMEDEVNDIKYDLSSYCKYKKIAKKSCSIELEYSKFGKIKNIKEPE